MRVREPAIILPLTGVANREDGRFRIMRCGVPASDSGLFLFDREKSMRAKASIRPKPPRPPSTPPSTALFVDERVVPEVADTSAAGVEMALLVAACKAAATEVIRSAVVVDDNGFVVMSVVLESVGKVEGPPCALPTLRFEEKMSGWTTVVEVEALKFAATRERL